MAQVKNGVSQEQDWKHIHVIIIKNNIENSKNEMYSSTSLSFKKTNKYQLIHVTALVPVTDYMYLITLRNWGQKKLHWPINFDLFLDVVVE